MVIVVLEQCVNGLSFFKTSENVFAAHKESGVMEGTLPHGTLLGVGNGAVLVEIAVPFAIFLISKVTKGIEVSLFKPFPIFFFFGDFLPMAALRAK